MNVLPTLQELITYTADEGQVPADVSKPFLQELLAAPYYTHDGLYGFVYEVAAWYCRARQRGQSQDQAFLEACNEWDV